LCTDVKTCGVWRTRSEPGFATTPSLLSSSDTASPYGHGEPRAAPVPEPWQVALERPFHLLI